MNPKRLSILLGAVIIVASVLGYVVLRTDSKSNAPSQQSNQLAANDLNKPSESDTMNWNVYTNSLYGYSIKYPKNWEIINEDMRETTEFSPIGEDYYIEGEPEIGVIRIVAAQNVKFDKTRYANDQQIKLDGRTAYKSTDGYGGEVSISFEIDGTPVSLVNDTSPAVTSSQYANKENEYNRIFDLMVSTLEFRK